MQPEDLQERWKEQGEEVFAEVAQWRAAHPQATLAEIEQAIDEQIHRLRARDWCVSSVGSRCKPAGEPNGGGRRREASRSKWNARM
jgi:hypothetical protein